LTDVSGDPNGQFHRLAHSTDIDDNHDGHF